MKPSRRANNRSSPGQSLVEFAVLLPLLLLILIGILDLGRLLATYVILENAARDGARYGGLHSTDPNIASDIQARVESEASGTIINTSQIQPVQCVPTSCTDAIGNPLQVKVTYPFTFITTYLFAGLNTLNVSTNATFQIQE